MTIESQIPKGWRFHSADFSRSNRPGRVMLTRDDQGYKWFSNLSMSEQEVIDLYATGFGRTLAEAAADAVAKIDGVLT